MGVRTKYFTKLFKNYHRRLIYYTTDVQRHDLLVRRGFITKLYLGRFNIILPVPTDPINSRYPICCAVFKRGGGRKIPFTE